MTKSVLETSALNSAHPHKLPNAPTPVVTPIQCATLAPAPFLDCELTLQEPGPSDLSSSIWSHVYTLQDDIFRIQRTLQQHEEKLRRTWGAQHSHCDYLADICGQLSELFEKDLANSALFPASGPKTALPAAVDSALVPIKEVRDVLQNFKCEMERRDNVSREQLQKQEAIMDGLRETVSALQERMMSQESELQRLQHTVDQLHTSIDDTCHHTTLEHIARTAIETFAWDVEERLEARAQMIVQSALNQWRDEQQRWESTSLVMLEDTLRREVAKEVADSRAQWRNETVPLVAEQVHQQVKEVSTPRMSETLSFCTNALAEMVEKMHGEAVGSGREAHAVYSLPLGWDEGESHERTLARFKAHTERLADCQNSFTQRTTREIERMAVGLLSFTPQIDEVKRDIIDLKLSLRRQDDVVEVLRSQCKLGSAFDEVKDWLRDVEKRMVSRGMLESVIGGLQEELSRYKRERLTLPGVVPSSFNVEEHLE